MTTPRIGDTVHYTAGNPPQCHHARVLDHLGDGPHGPELYLRVAYNDSLGHFHVATHQDENRTAATWHHAHEEQQ